MTPQRKLQKIRRACNAFNRAAGNGDVDALESLMNPGHNDGYFFFHLNITQALETACQAGQTQAVRLLYPLRNTDEVDDFNLADFLCLAVKSGKTDLVDYLIEQGADVRWRSPQLAATPIECALTCGTGLKMADHLLKKGAVISKTGGLSLDLALLKNVIAHGRFDSVVWLLASGPKLSEKAIFSRTPEGPYHQALREKQFRILRLLGDYNRDLNYPQRLLENIQHRQKQRQKRAWQKMRAGAEAALMEKVTQIQDILRPHIPDNLGNLPRKKPDNKKQTP